MRGFGHAFFNWNEVGKMSENILQRLEREYQEKQGKLVSVKLKYSLLEKLDELKKQSRRSRSDIINILLEQIIDDVEIT